MMEAEILGQPKHYICAIVAAWFILQERPVKISREDYLKKKINKTRELITALDYIRFYNHLSESAKPDIISGEVLLLEKLFDENQIEPYVVAIERDLNNVPCLFVMLRIAINKGGHVMDLAFFLFNASFLKNLDLRYPIHKWLFSKIFEPTTQIFPDDDFKKKNITLNINSVEKIFNTNT